MPHPTQHLAALDRIHNARQMINAYPEEITTQGAQAKRIEALAVLDHAIKQLTKALASQLDTDAA